MRSIRLSGPQPYAIAHPTLGKMIVSNIGTDDVVNALLPFWDIIAETASRAPECIEAVLNYVILKKYVSGLIQPLGLET